MIFIAYLVLFLSVINLLRMTIFLVGSDLYDVKIFKDAARNNKKSKNYYARYYRPLVTIIVPAHNEEKTLLRNLQSIVDSTYKNVELIIVNDCSTDKTANIAHNFQRNYRSNFKRIKVINVNVRGKARALNEGLKFAHGSLFMCLDADSALTSNALYSAVESFRDKTLGSLSSNVKIFPNPGLLNIVQRIEYLICYQMKKAETVTKTQYIVGGIGSMYRTRILRQLDLYETDTITEDIDLSMKLIERYGKAKHIGYNPEMVVFTEAVMSVRDLLQQRFRWKYGRYQVFLKRKQLFWSRNKNQSVLLSWFYLPYALFAELTYAIEPLTIMLILYLIFHYGDFTMVIGSLITFCFYTIMHVSGATQGYSVKERLKLSAFAPLAFVLMYVLSYVEYVATIKGLFNLRKLLREYRSGLGNCDWAHVARSN